MRQNRSCIASAKCAFLITLVMGCPVRGQKPVDESPIQPRVFTFSAKDLALKNVVSELSKQTGLEIDIGSFDPNQPVSATFERTEFWKAVDALAEKVGGRVSVGHDGKIRLVKAAGPRVANAVDGPFIVMPRAVEARLDLQTGKTSYDLTIDVAWEPRLPVYRIDAQPRVTNGKDDGGRAITVKPLDARNPTSGSVATLRFRLDGVTRDSKRIASLPGTLRVTAAEEMLRFEFNDLTRPAEQTQKGVKIGLRKFAKEGTYWIANLELSYPPGGAEFESFETFWLSRNRMTLIDPDGAKFPATDEEIDSRRVRYRFKEDKNFAPKNLKGWKMTFEAPGPIRETPVKFELKGIELP
jgi:hypothetical protein